jgi:Subtilase family
LGAPWWNLVTDSSGIPAGPGRTNYHGQRVASAAGAAVGNNLGSAGSGGTVARIAYFHDDRTADTAKRAMVRCTQWGIPFVVYSGEFVSVEFFFGTSAWNDTFNWAADNGTIMFAAAGNENRHLPDDAVQRPATRTPRALTVGATNADGTKASFSSWGTSVDVWAPGVGIPVGPTPSAPAGSSPDGTSFATPLTAGIAAMIRSVNGALDVDEIRDLIVSTGWDGVDKVTKGVDAYAAVWAAMAGRFKETNPTETRKERLFPNAAGVFEPIFGDAINRRGDTDEFELEVKTYSTLVVDLQWYAPLASLSIELVNEDSDGLAASVSVKKCRECVPEGPGRHGDLPNRCAGQCPNRVPTHGKAHGSSPRSRLP